MDYGGSLFGELWVISYEPASGVDMERLVRANEVVAFATLHTTAEASVCELVVRIIGGTPPYTVEFWRTGSWLRAQRLTTPVGLACANVPLETAMSGIVVRACGGGAWTLRQHLGAADLPLIKASISFQQVDQDSPDLLMLLSLTPFHNTPTTAAASASKAVTTASETAMPAGTTAIDGEAALATADATAAMTTLPPLITVRISVSAATSQSVCLSLAFVPQAAASDAASGRALMAISPLAVVGAAGHVAVSHVGRALAAVPFAVGEKLHRVGSNVRLSVAEMAGTAAAATIDRALAISAYAASGIGRQVRQYFSLSLSYTRTALTGTSTERILLTGEASPSATFSLASPPAPGFAPRAL